MANQTYKAFVARPSHILDLNGELLDSASVMSQLTSEVQGISSYATGRLFAGYGLLRFRQWNFSFACFGDYVLVFTHWLFIVEAYQR